MLVVIFTALNPTPKFQEKAQEPSQGKIVHIIRSAATLSVTSKVMAFGALGLAS